MRIFEGGNFNTYEEVINFDFYEGRGFCSYKGKYYVVFIEFFNKHGDEMNSLMKRLSDLANQEGLDFPQSFDSDAQYFLCTSRGIPYDGSKNYDRCYFNSIEEVVNAMKSKLNESLKSKIKFALKEDMIAKKNSRWNPDTQPNIFQLDVFLRKSGYRLFDVVNNSGKPELMIETIKEGHLHPDITHNVSEGEFYIDIKKYGQLVASDVEEIIKGYQTAVGVTKHLEKLDLSKLEYEGKEESKEDGETDSDS